MALDFTIEQVPDDWEALASAGREVMQHMDTGRWLAGDLANRCAVRYGETSLTKYAADIGIARAGTLREYARVSKFYDHATRVAFREGGLSWSHFRECMRAGDDAPVWLTVAVSSVSALAACCRLLAVCPVSRASMSVPRRFGLVVPLGRLDPFPVGQQQALIFAGMQSLQWAKQPRLGRQATVTVAPIGPCGSGNASVGVLQDLALTVPALIVRAASGPGNNIARMQRDLDGFAAGVPNQESSVHFVSPVASA
jgi:hypothetical protein